MLDDVQPRQRQRQRERQRKRAGGGGGRELGHEELTATSANWPTRDTCWATSSRCSVSVSVSVSVSEPAAAAGLPAGPAWLGAHLQVFRTRCVTAQNWCKKFEKKKHLLFLHQMSFPSTAAMGKTQRKMGSPLRLAKRWVKNLLKTTRSWLL